MPPISAKSSALETLPRREDYDRIFEAERRCEYNAVDTYVRSVLPSGFKELDRERLERVARVLACPLKKNPPNWQHGRIVYAAALQTLLRQVTDGRAFMLDIGTAKGFSALMALWAARDAQTPRSIVSLDVIDPAARVRRNTVAEVDGLLTLKETLDLVAPEASEIMFLKSTSLHWLAGRSDRIHFAFVDGKHRPEVVQQEMKYIVRLQRSGDVTVLDDCQIAGIAKVEDSLRGAYHVHFVRALENRRYAVATKR